ncbi:hypothetical protein [Candidatus Villigracilis affinis]|uniref:hypothetical protein n=1 Tax=Candidatus Villigracilis affinis TaxID=3140682 RepID=UPI002A1CFE25|nr:hypothetical protein [Anaerolineales bacterium]
MLLYFLYVGVTYTFSVIFNSLFLVYTALFSASLFAVIIALTTFDTQYLASKVTSDMPRRGSAIFMFVAGLGTLMLWLSELIGPLMTGQAPANLGPYTTMFTHGFDSAVITPATVITGIFSPRRCLSFARSLVWPSSHRPPARRSRDSFSLLACISA